MTDVGRAGPPAADASRNAKMKTETSKVNTPSNPAACQCGTEFMLGAGFCHVCGSPRHALNSSPQISWKHVVQQALVVVQFQNIKSWLNLPTASLIAFLFGLGCIFGALMTGMIYSAQNFSDFEAIQLWRMQWLLGSVAAFVAAILLKRSKG